MRPARSDFVDEEALRVPPSPDPRRRLRRSLQGVARRPARALRRLGRGRAPATSAGVRGDRRLAPRAGAPLPLRARAARRARDRARRTGRRPSRGGGLDRLRARRHLRRREAPVARPGADGRRRPAAAAAPRRPRRRLLWSGRFEEADRALAKAIELAERAGDERTRVRSRLSQLRLRFQVDPAADYEELEAERLEAAARCEANGDDFGAARAWRLVNWARWGSCKLEGMRRPAERAYEHDRRAKDPHYPQDDLIGVLVSMTLGTRRPRPGRSRRAQQILERVRGHRGAEAYALCFLGQLRGNARPAGGGARDDPRGRRRPAVSWATSPARR